jgi:hypothetical protein
MPVPHCRKLTVVAQDPAVSRSGRVVTTEIEVPNEALSEGPCGYRVHVIDYDPGADSVYAAMPKSRYGTLESPLDPFRKPQDTTILGDPRFHAQNVYATVMKTLERFEAVLGRRIPWGFEGHQICVAPHGMAGANAFYSRRDHALVFGYFEDPQTRKPVFSCLSHDIVVHETTHALLDGLRERFMDPSSADQAAFHEGYADVIALLSGFSMPVVVRAALQDQGLRKSIPMEKLTVESVKQSILTGLAEEMGSALSGARGNPLRRSVTIQPSRKLYHDPRYQEEHNRGELLVAAVMHAFLHVWAERMQTLGTKLADGGTVPGEIDATRVVEEAAAIAGRLLRIMIRAIDYTPPVHLRFGDFLSAALTADGELVPDDSQFGFRAQLRKSFGAFGIYPASDAAGLGLWDRVSKADKLIYSQTRFESLQHDRNEVFRFLWENRVQLDLSTRAHTDVFSVRPCRRVGPDGFILHETVAQYFQVMNLRPQDLVEYGIKAPKPAGNGDPNDDETYKMYGGGTLIFDEYGRLKFHITNRVHDKKMQKERMPRLWESDAYDEKRGVARRSFQALHLRRLAPWPLGVSFTPAPEKGA